MNPIPLPHGLQQIADAAGIEAALTIALARAGSRLVVPQRAEGSILEELVGIDAARQIAQALANERIEIPQARKVLNRWLREKGWSQEKRAMKLRLARRTVQYWDNDNTPSRQADLFGT
jgi:hypothetical protein